MRAPKLSSKLTLLLVAAAVVPIAAASPPVANGRVVMRDFGPPGFQLEGNGLARHGASLSRNAAYLTGSNIATHGEGAFAIDSDSGMLVMVDAHGDVVQSLSIGTNAGQLVYDPLAHKVFVADRNGDKIIVVDVTDDKMAVVDRIATPVEPYGVALSPDRKTLYVTTVADRQMVAFDTSTGKQVYKLMLSSEPRGIAVSPDGKLALITHLDTGTVDEVILGATSAKLQHVALATQANLQQQQSCKFCPDQGQTGGETFARNAFAGTFIGDDMAVVAFQRSTPSQQANGFERRGSYGGGFESPVSHQLAFMQLGDGGQQVVAEIGTHQPRSLAWDSAHDSLIVAGAGSDTLMRIDRVGKRTIGLGATSSISAAGRRCGPDGVAVTENGGAFVWCSLSRTVAKVTWLDGRGSVTMGAEVAPSSLSVVAQHGREIFFGASSQVSAGAAMACATCHPEGRADGLTWRIEGHALQTPVLAGRMAGTGPYKWDGGDADLDTSMMSTMRRLGGTGLDPTERAALAAYITSLPAPRHPSVDPSAVARGEKLFASDELGCQTCHSGKEFTDNERHALNSDLPEADTPSLIGLSASAPYYHDGSAATLPALLRGHAGVGGMADMVHLTTAQIDDLTAYLDTL